jgi:hypothetical protein
MDTNEELVLATWRVAEHLDDLRKIFGRMEEHVSDIRDDIGALRDEYKRAQERERLRI